MSGAPPEGGGAFNDSAGGGKYGPCHKKVKIALVGGLLVGNGDATAVGFGWGTEPSGPESLSSSNLRGACPACRRNEVCEWARGERGS